MIISSLKLRYIVFLGFYILILTIKYICLLFVIIGLERKLPFKLRYHEAVELYLFLIVLDINFILYISYEYSFHLR